MTYLPRSSPIYKSSTISAPKFKLTHYRVLQSSLRFVANQALFPDKLRGGYYTSAALAAWLCAWAIRKADDFVLEPSCGDGAFLEATS